MITDVTIYKKDTGEIVQFSSFMCPDDPEQIRLNIKGRLDVFGAETHDCILSQGDPAIHYVVSLGEDKLIENRPAIPYVVDKTIIQSGSGDFATISGLHSPCTVIIDDLDPLTETTTFEVVGGSFEFEAAVEGVYTIQISKFPFLPMTLQITAAEVVSDFSQDFSSEFF